MGTKIVVPNLGESIVEATVMRWLKKAGDPVQVGESLVELETEKVNLEVGAEQNGVLSQVLRGEGEDVRVGDVLGEIEAGDGAPPSQRTPEESSQPVVQAEAAAKPAKQPISSEARPAPEGEPQQVLTDTEEKATPLARRVAQMHGVDPAQIPGSGSGGRVVREDVERFIKEAPPERSTPVTEAAPLPRTSDGSRAEERVRLSRRRRTIAQHLVEALQNTAMLTTFNDVDMKDVMDFRARHKEAFKEKYGVSLGIMSFFVKASILALRDFPEVNAEIDGDELVLKKYYDIGIAVGAEEGLVVPVLRNADRMNFAQIETTIQSFVQRSREGKLAIDDLTGGTFSITNGGVYGSLMSTPILNYPQVAILGLHRIEERAVVRAGAVEVRPMMYLALSYDHRVIDGRQAVQFLARIKQVIERPEMLFLEL
ncbi:MAG TPA: 2-oxoglutarate dehydrogenase complex dihydrolipoyllysine-residue succinyltransferase [Anaerolineaceae bacterium]|nr:2-oxoglutarate dehydrogenase complex dihydrolipoyllysine-residue succinyltransferase [Anaerolineaceae bacterium]